MDWQVRMEQAREQYEDMERRLTEQDEMVQQMLNQHQEVRVKIIQAKHTLEGQMSIIGEFLQDQERLRIAGYERDIAEDNLRLAESNRDVPQQQQDVLQEMIAGKTPEQALAILNGVQQRLREKNLTNADA